MENNRDPIGLPPHPSLHFSLRRALFLDYFHIAQQTSASPEAGFTVRVKGGSERMGTACLAAHTKAGTLGTDTLGLRGAKANDVNDAGK